MEVLLWVKLKLQEKMQKTFAIVCLLLGIVNFNHFFTAIPLIFIIVVFMGGIGIAARI